MDLFLCLQFPRSDAKSHLQTQIESHLKFALRGLEATQHQVHELVAIVNDQSQQIERQSQQIERQLQQTERQSGQIERLMSKDNYNIARALVLFKSYSAIMNKIFMYARPCSIK